MARGATAITAGTTNAVPWFSRLGAVLEEADLEPARVYLAGLELRPIPGLALVRDWREAEQAARDPAWDNSWWLGEEVRRLALTREVTQRIGNAAMLDALSAAVEVCTEPTFAAALEASGDEALARVASGAALMAVHGRALALLAGRGDAHPFVQKYALFARGRWPLGLRGPETFLIF